MERLTLDEAIKYTKEIARANRVEAENYITTTGPYYNANLECTNQYEQISMWLKELKSYKDAEEQGLLVRFPCKVGDIVWDIDAGYLEPCKIAAFSYGCHDLVKFGCDDKITFYYTSCRRQLAGIFLLSELGKTVFLAREEAEKKLEEMKNE